MILLKDPFRHGVLAMGNESMRVEGRAELRFRVRVPETLRQPVMSKGELGEAETGATLRVHVESIMRSPRRVVNDNGSALSQRHHSGFVVRVRNISPKGVQGGVGGD